MDKGATEGNLDILLKNLGFQGNPFASLEAGDEAVVIDAELCRHASPPGMDGRILDDNEAHTAFGPPPMVCDKLVGHFVFERAKARVHGRHNDAVANHHTLDPNWLKHVWQRVVLHDHFLP